MEEFINSPLLIERTSDVIDRATGNTWTRITFELTVSLLGTDSSGYYRDGRGSK